MFHKNVFFVFPKVSMTEVVWGTLFANRPMTFGNRGKN